MPSRREYACLANSLSSKEGPRVWMTAARVRTKQTTIDERGVVTGNVCCSAWTSTVRRSLTRT